MMNSQIGKYDESYRDKLKSLFPDRVVYAPPDHALDEIRKYRSGLSNTQGNEFPFVSLWRIDEKINIENYNRAMFIRGRTLGVEGTKAGKLKMLPLSLSYQMDIWSLSKTYLDELYREFMFALVGDPKLKITLSGDEFIFDLRIDSEEDNSDIAEFLEKRKLYRKTIITNIDNALIFTKKEIDVITSVDINILVE